MIQPRLKLFLDNWELCKQFLCLEKLGLDMGLIHLMSTDPKHAWSGNKVLSAVIFLYTCVHTTLREDCTVFLQTVFTSS